jgi:hypothetical protein
VFAKGGWENNKNGVFDINMMFREPAPHFITNNLGRHTLVRCKLME